MPKSPRTKRQQRPSTAEEKPGEHQDALTEEAIVDPPDREVMSLLPTSMGGLSGVGGLGGSLLGSGTAPTHPTVPPLNTPTLPTGANPLPGQPLTGADQTAPIAQQSSSTK